MNYAVRDIHFMKQFLHFAQVSLFANDNSSDVIVGGLMRRLLDLNLYFFIVQHLQLILR